MLIDLYLYSLLLVEILKMNQIGQITEPKLCLNAPECLTICHPKREIGFSLVINGSPIPAVDSAPPLPLRRDRVDKESAEVTYVSTDNVRITGGTEFEVYEKDVLFICGSLERLDTDGGNGSGWEMDCHVAAGSIGSGSSAFFRPKLGVSAPSVEVYVAGCCSGVPVILSKTISMSPRRRVPRHAILDAIPEDEEMNVIEKDHGNSMNGLIPLSILQFVVIRFPGSWVQTDWFVTKPFGETKIDLAHFPLLKSVGNDETALVNQTFLNRFDRLFKFSSIISEVKKGMAEGKQVVFTGHSSGAVLAILVTFWALEENLNQTQLKPPMCVTFGSPLVGNHIFSHASNRQNWSRRFIHFVMRYDIVPRIFLAPFSSIEKIFSPVLQLLTPDNDNFESQDSIRDSMCCEFYSIVMMNATTVTRHVACNLMGSTNLLLETMTNFVELSPYRTFGTYIFYNVYEAEFEESLAMQNVVYLNKLDDLPLSSGDAPNTDVATALDSLGLSVRARLCLRAAGELEKKRKEMRRK
ncbi:unnamed protein product [Vicia faba]|uniref:Fungal lipase-type domain-containing protein n=1 Tax=Vicia faba TaxID=3906 RepID=A0AAV0YL03_VICFA|nr:unnamed protein product [Vicia faba]